MSAVSGRRLALVVGLMACGSGSGAKPDTTEQDSAGVTIVTTAAPAWSATQGWRVDSTPRFAVGDGARRGDPLLIDVRAARLAPGGEVVVVTGDDRMIRWIDPQGQVVATRGGVGDGPGHFGDLIFVGMIGDSVVVWDNQRQLVTLLTRDSSVTRTFPLRGGEEGAGSKYGYIPVGIVGTESLVLAGRRGASTNEKSGLRRDSVPLATARFTGEIAPPFAVVPGAETVVVSTNQFVTMIPRPFGAQTAVTVDGDVVLVTLGDRDEVFRYLPATGLQRIDRLNRPRRLIAPAAIDQQGKRLGAQTAQLPKPVATAIFGAMLEAGIPSVYATFDRILTDSDGNQWLREDIGSERPLSEARQWVVLNKKGGWLGVVTTPVHFEVHQILRDQILGVMHESNGGEVVQLLPLRR